MNSYMQQGGARSRISPMGRKMATTSKTSKFSQFNKQLMNNKNWLWITAAIVIAGILIYYFFIKSDDSKKSDDTKNTDTSRLQGISTIENALNSIYSNPDVPLSYEASIPVAIKTVQDTYNKYGELKCNKPFNVGFTGRPLPVEVIFMADQILQDSTLNIDQKKALVNPLLFIIILVYVILQEDSKKIEIVNKSILSHINPEFKKNMLKNEKRNNSLSRGDDYQEMVDVEEDEEIMIEIPSVNELIENSKIKYNHKTRTITVGKHLKKILLLDSDTTSLSDFIDRMFMTIYIFYNFETFYTYVKAYITKYGIEIETESGPMNIKDMFEDPVSEMIYKEIIKKMYYDEQENLKKLHEFIYGIFIPNGKTLCFTQDNPVPQNNASIIEEIISKLNVDCKISDWIAEGECSAPCGGGEQVYTRSVISEGQFGGKPCPANMKKIVPCNTQPCPSI